MDSPLDKYTTPLNADEFQAALFADRFPVSYHDCENIAKLTEETCRWDGYFTIGLVKGNKTYVINAYNKNNEMLANYVINQPEISKDRKIPSFDWVANRFYGIGYKPGCLEIKQTHKQIESHLRDGGSYEYFTSGGCVRFDLKIRGQIKASLIFYKEELFIQE